MPRRESLAIIRRRLTRGSPYGNAAWVMRTAWQLGLQSILRRRGQPFKNDDKGTGKDRDG